MDTAVARCCTSLTDRFAGDEIEHEDYGGCGGAGFEIHSKVCDSWIADDGKDIQPIPLNHLLWQPSQSYFGRLFTHLIVMIEEPWVQW